MTAAEIAVTLDFAAHGGMSVNRRPSKAAIASRKAEIARRYARRDRRAYDKAKMFTGVRRREIEAIIKSQDGTLPDTDDRELILSVWAAHNIYSRDQSSDLAAFGRRLHVKLSNAEIARVLAYVDRTPRRYRARTLGRILKLTNDTREFLRITTIEAYDITPAKRRRLRKAAERERKRVKRRAAGVMPRFQYDARRLAKAINAAAKPSEGAAIRRAGSIKAAMPWVAEGISRTTWFRRRKSEAPQGPSESAAAIAAERFMAKPKRGFARQPSNLATRNARETRVSGAICTDIAADARVSFYGGESHIGLTGEYSTSIQAAGRVMPGINDDLHPEVI